MCGIYLSISHKAYVSPSERELELLKKRGPDSCCTVREVFRGHSGSVIQYLTFCSTVLFLRGQCVVEQPLQDSSTKSILCWNGEAWKYDGNDVEGNDAQVVFSLLLKAAKESAADADTGPADPDTILSRTLSVLSKISGPFAFVFYEARSHHIFFGRDVLGRRTLVTRTTEDGTILISSVCGDFTFSDWTEVEANGIYIFDLNQAGLKEATNNAFQKDEQFAYRPKLIPWTRRDLDTSLSLTARSPFSAFNEDCPPQPTPILSPESSAVVELTRLLKASVSIRIRDIPSPPCGRSPARFAILFSGGVDCSLLARLCHDIIPINDEIDLLNVAFENPRVVKATAQATMQPVSALESGYSSCPDRCTGLKSFAELQSLCPGRAWRFVSIDIPYKELLDHRSQIQALIHPHDTEMDLSIASALYFAARGVGTIHSSSKALASTYTSPARVLLSGLGADELFAGYTRHATAFARKGYGGLAQELDVDYRRLGKRNLGRDDRVMSYWGKETRYPYLDETIVEWALQMPVWMKCGFGQESSITSKHGQIPNLDPAKLALRLVALTLGMSGVAMEKKRAIQFGTRTAKMETGKTKGTQILN